ncbi:MAG: twin-arginine translocase TatA/TatE family subunit [Verrucomicrobiia bacterium]
MSLPLAVLDDWHIIVLALLVVLLFGGKKLPEVARGLGEAMREFKKASRDLHDDPQRPTGNTTTPPPAQPTAAAPQHSSEPKQG